MSFITQCLLSQKHHKGSTYSISRTLGTNSRIDTQSNLLSKIGTQNIFMNEIVRSQPSRARTLQQISNAAKHQHV